MNILYINFTDKVSGGETSLLYYLAELKKYVNPVVVSPKKGDFSNRLDAAGIKNYTFPLDLLSKKNPLLFLRTVYCLVRLIIREKIDIIHANGTPSNQSGAIASVITGRPLILHVQNFVEEKYYSKYFFRLTKKFIVLSQSVINHFPNSEKNKNKIVLLHHAVPKINNNKKSRFLHDELRINRNKKLVAVIGLLEERKGHEYFIRAAKLVKNNACYLIVGDALFTDDEYKNRIKKLVKDLNLSNVYFLGYRKDIHKILNEIDILVVPSINEPLGVIVLEAASVSVPAIVFNSGALPEMIENRKTGFIVQEKDYIELAKRIDLLLQNDKLRKDTGKNARKKIEEEFSIEDNSKKILNIYREIKCK